MLIKYTISVNAEFHVIITRVCDQNEGNNFKSMSVFPTPVTLEYLLWYIN